MAGYNNDGNYGYERSVNICMIGPSGVGKTSLLATMHKTLQGSFGGRLKFEPLNKEAFKILRDKYTSLSKLVDRPAATRVINTDIGNQKIQEYPFGLDHVDANGKRGKITLVNFFDTPGAMTSDLHEDLEEKIRESQIIINALDAGVMMKAGQLDAERFNGYAEVKRLLDDCVFTENACNKLVIFTLIKAETWIMERSDKRDVASDVDFLIRTMHSHMQDTLDLFPPAAPRLGIICPVETLGCVEFSMVSKNTDGIPEVHYKRVYGKKFEPRHVQLPLYYALRFILAEWCNRRSFLERLFDEFIGQFFKQVLDAIYQMDAEEIEKMEHATITPLIYGNQELLEIQK